ncbi:helix-turn-helix domain-containing protein [Mesonia maritima]|uniref:AraC-like DNA-binding protein n=1 Tax=Mesonia maritima TaxID=1793873 RepID=A0ABU1K4E2_9FLAO|nr:helix-turn-helix transcriptional regulator [Mesonia maritima]MDR6300485.1 AraC-like DNA-binding protein [Mesonia maritima]
MYKLTEKDNREIHHIQFNKEINPYGICVNKIEYEEDASRIAKIYRTSFYRMIWVCKGSVSVELDMNTVELTKDHCLFIGKNQVFKLKNYKHFDAYIVDFTESFYARTQLDSELLHQSNLFNNKKGVVKLYLEDPYKEILIRFLGFFHNISKANFSPLLYQLAHNTVERMLLFAEWNLQQHENSEQIKSNSKGYSLLNRFQTLVANHFVKEKTVGFYADELKISSRNLAKICSTLNKPSPKKIITERIITEAKRLLKFTDLSIKEVSFRLGYEEPNTFIKLFTSNVGLSPLTFREKYRD